MCKYFLLVIVFLTSWTLRAQELGTSTVSSAGNTFSTGDIVVNWTLGEVVSGVVEFQDGIRVNQGLHQSLLIVTALDPTSVKDQIKIFPNPTADYLTISLEERKNRTIELYDLSGNLLKNIEDRGNGQLHRMDLSEYQDGMYILTINTVDNSLVDKYKIIKTSGK